MRIWLIAAALMLLVPAGLQAKDLASDVREFAQITAGAPLPPNADAVLSFEREPSGELVMTGMGLVAQTGGSFAAQEGTVAILRTRSNSSENWLRPDREDVRFASQFAVPVFVFSVKRSKAYWELDARSSPPRFRSFGSDGSPGEWVTLQN